VLVTRALRRAPRSRSVPRLRSARQGRAAAAALEGISRNPGAAPRIQTPMILGLALIESLVLFAFLIAFLLQNKI
jgi:F0F1-type ATP synthase membrane subunit c/vacuolar-type H+-ATPase subunit K